MGRRCSACGGIPPTEGRSVRGATYQVVVDGEVVTSTKSLAEARELALDLGGTLQIA